MHERGGLQVGAEWPMYQFSHSLQYFIIIWFKPNAWGKHFLQLNLCLSDWADFFFYSYTLTFIY